MAIQTALFVPYAYPGDCIAAGVAFPVIGIVAVLLRFWVRNSRKNQMAVDDWLMIPALLCVIGMGACMIAATKKRAFGYPTPSHAPNLTKTQLLNLKNPIQKINAEVEFAFTLLMIWAYCFIKVSILMFYRRLFVVNRNTIFSTLTWLLTGIIIVWATFFNFFIIFACGKHIWAKFGSRQDLASYCSDGLQRQEALYISEFLTNILLLVLPIPMIWKLHMHWQRKLAVTGIILLAFMALAASVIRLVIVLEIVTKGYALAVDADMTIGTILYWGMIEAGLALIAACLPMLKPLVTDHSIQSAINSVRSAISLQSMNTQNRTSPHSSKGSGKANGNTLSNSYNKIDGGVSEEAILRGDHIMEMESGATRVELPAQAKYVPGRINVQRDVDVSSMGYERKMG